MLDFFQVCQKDARGGVIEVYPDFIVGRSKDLMVRGQAFYAIWNEEKGLWSTVEYDVKDLVDKALLEYAEKLKESGTPCTVKLLRSNSSNVWNQYKKYLKNASDDAHQLDMKLTFQNTEVKKSDYVSRRLPYNLAPGDFSAWDELVGTLYSPEERAKIEWAIGAVISGDSKKIEKFLVFYGPGGTGKSTIMKIIQKLFAGYIAMFEAKALVGNNNTFAAAVFKSNPLVAIQHDGDLSKIEDNSVLNSVVGHDTMVINEKYKSGYEAELNAMLFMGTNKPVKITDAKSGLIRRLIDVSPSLQTFEPNHYQTLMTRIEFELGAIAQHCLDVYRDLGKNKYNDYRPTKMMFQTDVFYNFISEHFDIFKSQDGTTLQQAWKLYKEYAEHAELGFKMKLHQFREALKDYFDDFQDRGMLDDAVVRSLYKGFTAQQFKTQITQPKSKKQTFSLVMEETESLLDEMYAGYSAQYSNARGNPKLYWDGSERFDKDGNPFTPKPSEIVSTVLGDLDTSKLHFLKIPEHHIVIDFDLEGDDGEKSLERNLEAASSWPHTYAEFSKSGKGVHLHYIYDGDTSELAPEYSPGIEIKVYRGNGSLRRKLTKCNNVSVATISSGLPFREKKVHDPKALRSEQGLRRQIIRNLNKEVHPGTKPSVDFIEHLLKEAHASGLIYDVSDMRQSVMSFGSKSSNQAQQCLKAVTRMKFKSEVSLEEADLPEVEPADDRIVFFDCEVYPNLFVVCWKYHGSSTVVQMVEPTSAEIENLLKFKLVGFNNRGYDNHILYARSLGATTEELYRLSQRIIVEKDNNAKYGPAWGISYADVYDFSVKKQGLKPWEIELGIPHVEMDIPWDEPVPENKVAQVIEYCCNDVNALESVFDHLKQDFAARQILADLSGYSVNHSTRQHAIRIMFGNERDPQKKFVYTDLSEMFPGYEFNEFTKTGKSTYRGEVVGEGGYVYAEPGMYENVALLDIASMHPTSIEELNLFGPYTSTFSEIKNARLSIKHADEALARSDFELAEKHLNDARTALGGKLAQYIEVGRDGSTLQALSDALKLVINSIYGYTSAKFANPFRDPRNKDNIVAKRGALAMIDIKNAVQEQGFTVAHIKTDSIKIPNATPEIIQFVKDLGAKYGYTFEHEATYKKMCLVNDAVFIAYVGWNAKNKPEHWKAVGAQFQHPYVFKRLFTDEPVYFKDLCETKQVKEGVMYLRFDGVLKEIGGDPREMALDRGDLAADYDDTHIGRSGLFVPINPDQDMLGGGQLLRIKNGNEYAVTGTKGYLWAEAEMVRALQEGAVDRMLFERPEDAVQGTGSITDVIDMLYYEQLAEDAAQAIAKFGDFEGFVK